MKVKEIVTEASWAQAFDNVVNAAMGTTSSGKFGNKPGDQNKLVGKAIPQLSNAFHQQWVQQVQKLQNAEQARNQRNIDEDTLANLLDRIIENDLQILPGMEESVSNVAEKIVYLTNLEVQDANSTLKNNEKVRDEITKLITVAIKLEASFKKIPVEFRFNKYLHGTDAVFFSSTLRGRTSKWMKFSTTANKLIFHYEDQASDSEVQSLNSVNSSLTVNAYIINGTRSAPKTLKLIQ